jgi:uncharacterized alkaline shock family protein YloU
MKSNLVLCEVTQETDLMEIARRSSLVAHNRLMATITKHAEHVGPDGKGVTSKAGLAIQINRKIKKVFGRTVDEIKDDYGIDTLMVIKIKIDRVIKYGESVPLNRSAIKKLIYQAIEDVYRLMNYHTATIEPEKPCNSTNLT